MRSTLGCDLLAFYKQLDCCRTSKATGVFWTDKPSETAPSTEQQGHQVAVRHSGPQGTQQNLLYEIKGELQLLGVAGRL